MVFFNQIREIKILTILTFLMAKIPLKFVTISKYCYYKF